MLTSPLLSRLGCASLSRVTPQNATFNLRVCNRNVWNGRPNLNPRLPYPLPSQLFTTRLVSDQAASSTKPSSGRLARILGRSLVVGALGYAVYLLDDQYNYRTIARNLRTLWNGAAIAIDYKLNFDPDSLESINALHERAAGRLLNVCEKNGGLYVKMGQAIGTQAAVLPAPYRQLAKLLDDAERLDYTAIEKVIRTELGASPDEVFVRFDREPIAAASIAQVHRARIRLPNGDEEEVAVKVQRPDIRRHAKWDLWAYRTMLLLYEKIFDLPLSFFGQYISDQIEQETHFDNEARNTVLIRSLVQTSRTPLIRNTCYVPRIHPSHSTSRILTMEYIPDACRLTDIKKIEEMGLSVKEVARSVCEVFAAQMFEMGFLQADGHPSNVLIRKHPNGKRGQHEVVLIDHGLYVSLSPDFRLKYAQLWKAIFEQDLPTMRDICLSWGIGNPELFASATLLRPWRAKQRTNGDPQANVRKESEKTDLEMQREMKERLKSFLVNVELLPKELIFVGRGMRILQANNQALGSPINRVNILAHHAASAFLSTSSPTPTLSFSTRIISYCRFRFTLFIIDVAFRFTRLRVYLRKFRRRSSEGIGFEDELEEGFRRMAKSEFGVELGREAFEG